MRHNERDIQFNVDAYTARLIGRENVSKLEGAVLKLVFLDEFPIVIQCSRNTDSFIPVPLSKI